MLKTSLKKTWTSPVNVECISVSISSKDNNTKHTGHVMMKSCDVIRNDDECISLVYSASCFPVSVYLNDCKQTVENDTGQSRYGSFPCSQTSIFTLWICGGGDIKPLSREHQQRTRSSYRQAEDENDSPLTGMTDNSFKYHSTTVGWHQVTSKKKGKRQLGWSAR